MNLIALFTLICLILLAVLILWDLFHAINSRAGGAAIQLTILFLVVAMALGVRIL